MSSLTEVRAFVVDVLHCACAVKDPWDLWLKPQSWLQNVSVRVGWSDKEEWLELNDRGFKAELSPAPGRAPAPVVQPHLGDAAADPVALAKPKEPHVPVLAKLPAKVRCVNVRQFGDTRPAKTWGPLQQLYFNIFFYSLQRVKHWTSSSLVSL